MSIAHTLEVSTREFVGTGAARAVRRSGLVPGIIYGNQQDSQNIAIDPKALIKEWHSPGFFNRVYTLNLNGQEQQVLPKDVQMHPVTDQPLHVDFQRVSQNSTIHISVPVVFINEDKSPGVKRGGSVNVVHHTVELICPVHSIPESLIVDLTGKELNQAVHLTDLSLPAGVVPAHPERDNTLATIVGGSASEEKTAE